MNRLDSYIYEYKEIYEFLSLFYLTILEPLCTNHHTTNHHKGLSCKTDLSNTFSEIMINRKNLNCHYYHHHHHHHRNQYHYDHSHHQHHLECTGQPLIATVDVSFPFCIKQFLSGVSRLKRPHSFKWLSVLLSSLLYFQMSPVGEKFLFLPI